MTTWQELKDEGWRKPLRSSSNGGNCVGIRADGSGVGVVDTKNPDGTRLGFSADAWAKFGKRLKQD